MCFGAWKHGCSFHNNVVACSIFTQLKPFVSLDARAMQSDKPAVMILLCAWTSALLRLAAAMGLVLGAAISSGSAGKLGSLQPTTGNLEPRKCHTHPARWDARNPVDSRLSHCSRR